MNEIAVFMSENNIISSFTESKCVTIFAQEEDLWKEKKEILLDKKSCKKGISELREYYKNLVHQMDNCKIILVNKAFGIPYSVFYTEDFSIWELEGNPVDFLDEIMIKEKEEEDREENQEEVAKKLGDGHFFIDLMELEISKPEMSSKKAIIPFLEKNEVRKIEIHCCHVPPWLIKEQEKNEIQLEIDEIKRNEFNVIIEKSKTGGK